MAWGPVDVDNMFFTSLSALPKFNIADVVRIVKTHSSVKSNRLDKGYKFVNEEFVYNYQGQ